MTLALLSGASGNPINLKRRVAQQPTRSLPPAESTYKDFESNGGPFAIEPSEIDRQLISLGGIPAGGLTGKINLGTGPFQIGDVDPANPLYIHALANLFDQHKHTDNTTWQEWHFSKAGSGFADSDEFISILNDNDVLPRMRLIDMIIGAMRWTTSPNANLSNEIDFVVGEVDMHGLVSQEVGSGSSEPKFRKLHQGNLAADADLAEDGDIFVRIDDVSGSPDIVISAKIGASSAYSASQTITLGSWFRLFDESGDRIGLEPSELAEQVLIRFSDPATLTDLDEFKVAGRRIAWTQSLPVTQPISSVNTIFFLDGEEIRTEGGWDVELAWETVEGVQDVAGRQTATTQKSGDLVATITPTRRVVDMTFQAALLNASVVSIVIDAEGEADIGASGRKFRSLIIAPECRVFGTTFGVEPGGENREESVILKPKRPDTVPFVFDSKSVEGHLDVIVENDITTLV